MEIFEATGIEEGRLKGQMLYRFVIRETERDGHGRIVKVHGSHQKVGSISPELFSRLRDNGAADAELYRLFPEVKNN